MTLRRKIQSILTLGAFAALAPLYAQGPPSEMHGSTHTTTTTTRTSTSHHSSNRSPARSTAKTRVYADANRLATILHDSRGTFGAGAWRGIANEATTLANRIYTNASTPKSAHDAARELRKHVQMLRAAAMKGDSAGAKDHAQQALPYDYTLVEWSKPGR